MSNFIQNHDQIGNRPRGERLSVLVKPEALEAALAVLLLQPSPPLMFMGDEWGATEPFLFFCDFHGELGEAVRKGRKAEYADWHAQAGDGIPDPLAKETKDAAVLDWNALTKPVHAERLALTRALLKVRHEHIAPLLPAMIGAGEASLEGGLLQAHWHSGGKTLMLLANLSDGAKPKPAALELGRFDLGRNSAATIAALVGLCRHRRHVMPPAVPLATYRLQLTKDFGFDQAAALAPYLKQLGITHLYASPFLKARPGSTHGYDIVDHDRINPELGGEEGFARLSEALKANDLGLILDFVPNHMGVGHADNAWWLDVLEWGQRSPYAASFDIDWDALPHRRHPGVLLPILGRPYGDALQAGEIELKYDADTGSFAAWYFDHKLPINPQRYSEMLRTIVARRRRRSRPGVPCSRSPTIIRAQGAPSYREAPALKQRLREIDGAADVIARGLAAYRSDNEAGAAALHRLLERQHYRLAYWRVAFSAVNYRRFFDINDLAGLRVENKATFNAIHTLVARLIGENKLQGLRLDHIDGLRDPVQYTRRLRQLIQKARRQAKLRGTFYVVVEKILADNEPLPHFPGVAGTTGYEWLNVISRVLVDGKGLDPLERTWRDFTGERATFASMVEAAKRTVIETMLASEFTVLCRGLARIAAGHFSTRDFTIDRLRAALQAYVLAFPVYRTYVTAAGASAEDRKLIEDAIARARENWEGPDPDIFDFLRDAITLDLAHNPGYSAPRVRNFALKLQQFTGPLTAKALEDTAFYRYNRLLALNEVGGDPALPALSRDEFHRRQQQHAETQPNGLTATATHDTKRGEDARARILALSELAERMGRRRARMAHAERAADPPRQRRAPPLARP